MYKYAHRFVGIVIFTNNIWFNYLPISLLQKIEFRAMKSNYIPRSRVSDTKSVKFLNFVGLCGRLILLLFLQTIDKTAGI